VSTELPARPYLYETFRDRPRSRSETHVQPAVDRNVGAGDVAGLVVAEEADRARDLGWLPEAADGDAVDNTLADLFGDRSDQRGFAVAGRHRVHRHALARHLARQRHGEAVHTRLGGRIV